MAHQRHRMPVSGWNDFGATDGGVRIEVGFEKTEWEVDQETAPIDKFKNADSGGIDALMYLGEMISPCQISSLPDDTIIEGAHVGLDIRGCRLRVARTIRDPTALAVVEVAEYALRDTDVALLFFEYLQRCKARFESVKII